MKHPQFITDILNHPDISEADKETAKAEVEKMVKARRPQREFPHFWQGDIASAFDWTETSQRFVFWWKMEDYLTGIPTLPDDCQI
jgi:hypothetical protein